jgi:hypothetical protein
MYVCTVCTNVLVYGTEEKRKCRTKYKDVREGTKDVREGTKDVREGTKDVRQGREKGTEEWMT